MVTFVLAWLTYECLEKPIRYSKRALTPAIALFGSVMAVGVVGYFSFAAAFLPRSANYGLEKIVAAATEKVPFPGPRLKALDQTPSPLYEQREQSTKIVMIGDSHIARYYPRIDRLLTGEPKATRVVVFASNGGCPPLPKVTELHHAYCDGLVERAVAYALRPDVDSVLIAGAWQHYFLTADEFRRAEYQYTFDGEPLILGTQAYDKALAAFGQMIEQLTKNGKRVSVLLQSPMLEELAPRQMVRRSLTDFSFALDAPVITRAKIVESTRAFIPSLEKAAISAGAEVIDPLDWLCGPSTCPALGTDGQPIYHGDDGHLNPAYVREHVPFLDQLVL